MSLGHLLYGARRPLLAFGWGVRLSGAEEAARSLVERLWMPFVCTWGAIDILGDHPLCVGTFGTHGVRPANFAVQTCDLLITVGTRLDTKATGAPVSSFAPKAKLVMVDVDEVEVGKFQKLGRRVDLGLVKDAKSFCESVVHEGHLWPEWVVKTYGWRRDFPIVLPEYRKQEDINPYVLIEQLSDFVRKEDVLVTDTGCSLGWVMQAYKWKGERFIHAFNATPMGYGLPAAIGASFATGRRVVLVCGDGGLSLSAAELATAAKHDLDIKAILFNNKGHAMCRQTERQWLNGEYCGTSEKDLATPDFLAVATAYGWCTEYVNKSKDVPNALRTLMNTPRPTLLVVDISPEQGLAPQARFGTPLEDQEPALPRLVLEEALNV